MNPMQSGKYADKYGARVLPRLSLAELGRPHYRLRNPLVGGRLYVYEQPVYDYYGVIANTVVTRQVLFTVPQGQQFTPAGGAAFVKSAWHTLLTQAGQLSAPQKHVTRAISIAFRGNISPNDLNRFLFQVLLQFEIDQQNYLQTLCQKIGGGGGSFSGAAAGIVSNGVPQSSNFFLLHPTGETLEQQQNFRVILDPTLFQDGVAGGAFTTDAVGATPPGTGVHAIVSLEGQLARAVQ